MNVLFPAVPVWLVVSLILTRTVAVYAPVCPQHTGYFWKRKLAVGLLVLGANVGMLTGLALVPNAGPGGPAISVELALGLLAGVLGFLVSMAVVGFIHWTQVRATRITRNEVRLTNVSEEFVAALDEQRQAEEHEKSRPRRSGSGDDHGSHSAGPSF